MPSHRTRLMVLASAFAALTSIGAYIAVPLGPVPVVLTNLFVFLSGLLLGSRWGAVSMVIYLLLGVAGFPVFAQGSGGLGHLLGPTGGYLLGFVLAAWVVGFVTERSPDSTCMEAVALVLGCFSIYLLGLPWLKVSLDLTWTKAFYLGMVPFLAGDALKIAAVIFLSGGLRQMMSQRRFMAAP